MKEKHSYEKIEESKDYPQGVYYCSPTNSTFFTRCCDCAITDREERCPSCGLYVVGWDSGNKNMSRSFYAKKKQLKEGSEK